MKVFKMPSNDEIREQNAKGLHLNVERITLTGLELISEQIFELNKKIDQGLRLLKKSKVKAKKE